MNEYIIPATATVIVKNIEAIAAGDRMKTMKSRAEAEKREQLRTEKAWLSIIRGWHSIKVKPDVLSRVEFDLVIQLFANSRGGGQY